LTGTGTGGVGKSRIALHVAATFVDAGDEDTWLVELATLSGGALVAPAVAHAVGLEESSERAPIDILIARLAKRSLLLVLDNCEHLIAEVANVAAALLGACPALRILATSREPCE
jgi:predicted ATPase